jgi:hypothetical protein
MVCLILLVVHFFWLSHSPKRDLLFLLPAASLGISGDFLLIQGGVFTLPPTESLFPLWLLGLWLLFPLTLLDSMAPLFQKTLSRIGLGWAAGFSYYAGNYFGILFTSDPVWLNLALAGLAWCLYLQGFYLIWNKLNRLSRSNSLPKRDKPS